MPVEIFNASEYRQKRCGHVADEEWFDQNNLEVQKLRASCNTAALDDIIAFLDKHANGVAILDSTNPDHARRETIRNRVIYHLYID